MDKRLRYIRLVTPFLPVALGHPESEWRLLPSLRTCFFGGTGKIAARWGCERIAMLPGEPKPEGRGGAKQNGRRRRAQGFRPSECQAEWEEIGGPRGMRKPLGCKWVDPG